MKRLLIALLIACLFIGVVAADQELTEAGVYSGPSSTVNLTQSDISFSDTHGFSITTAVKVNDNPKDLLSAGVVPTRTATATMTSTLVSLTPTQEPLGDPQVVFAYHYVGDTLKESISMDGPATLSFPVTLNENEDLIQMPNGEWKVVSSAKDIYGNHLNTMAGIVAKQPFGYDANGNYIPMWYTYDGTALTLTYNDTVKQLDPESTPGNPIYDDVDIAYPINIDPTWIAYNGHYVAYTSNTTIEYWNATGIASWTVPLGVTKVNYLIVGGGGGGGGAQGTTGGGGGGGFATGTNSSMVPGTTINVTVGSGGTGGVTGFGANGLGSDFNNVVGIANSLGGGGGAISGSPGSGGASGGGWGGSK